MKKVYIESNGCAVLRHETERITKFFKLNGFEEVTQAADAEILVMTCCGVTHNEEDEAIETIKRMENERSANSIFIVSGCLPSFAQERIRSVAPSAQLITYLQFPQFNDIIQAAVNIEDVYFNVHPTKKNSHNEDVVSFDNEDEQLAVTLDKAYDAQQIKEQYDFCTLKKYIWQDDDVYQIKVSQGCPGSCTYCATKLAIGDFRSVPKELVIRQFKEGVQAGYKRFLLVGDEIGCYGSDFGETIIDLLNDVCHISNEITLGIRYIHPDIFVKYYDRFKSFFANGFIYFFCAAVQSGSPAMLKSMNRNPDIEPFIQCMEDMKKQGYKVNKHTQILVGYPGETGDDVLATLQCLARCDFDHININKYSPRKGTKSFDVPDDVPEEEKVKRCHLFREIMMLQKKGKLYDAIKDVVLRSTPAK